MLFERSISYSRGLYISKIYEANGVKVVNSPQVAERCGDKYVTSQILVQKGIPTPRVLMAFDEESALAAAEEIGYPCVLKPVVGSWGRLLAKVDDRSTAEAFIEHKATLGVNHQVFYLQEYIDKPGRDIRAFVVGDEPFAPSTAPPKTGSRIQRAAGLPSNCPLTPELVDICQQNGTRHRRWAAGDRSVRNRKWTGRERSQSHDGISQQHRDDGCQHPGLDGGICFGSKYMLPAMNLCHVCTR